MGGVGVAKSAVWVAVMVAAGCASGASNRVDRASAHGLVRPPVGVVAASAEAGADGFPTLLVENRSGYQVAIRMNGRRVGTATPGRTCLRLPGLVGELRLEFVALAHRGHQAPVAFFEESAHWAVELNPGVTIKYEVLSLTPQRRSCAE